MDTKELGTLGESIACEYLVKRGYNILAKNYSISFGEIDIIAKKKLALLNKIFQILITSKTGLFNRVKKLFSNDKTIHFVEVKTILGNNDSFYPEEKVDYQKRSKLRKLCLIWLGKKKYSERTPYQIDVIGIVIDQHSRNARVHYFPNVVEDNY